MKSRSESLIRLKKFQVDEKRRQVTQIEMMIADFERMASDLDQQIEIEHQKTGISDIAHFAYSTFAKAALQRRDNLLASANDMREKLEGAQDALAEAIEDLKKVELLDQREHQREVAEQNKIEQAEYDEIARLRFRNGR
ncbi:flagellar export protein FliJ [Paradevosia shaoguanensis]|uniref:Flagellar FliJ protein n=1 Tax=Paradevosia shaoguanensis TaxID=1335043 RepID=A0AA41QQT9_9HYPH|nr:flagellar export protein FliJ [Paradevosia shaoguanensis]KFL28900.1 flagellar export protein FliJ [Devosia sp. 17-2-E-8]QMV00826.1 flagellar export protein FliJ [Devosia sp. D6-9]CDP53069.1 Flagellar protein FliJ [Devosia sp. DBB001]MCF1744390.1 flagellar export protein FliJ [Paradevosia shaoguanensis]MCI0128873.1 flagellar export protein FliJ [Paradevosia shaoguanensis]